MLSKFKIPFVLLLLVSFSAIGQISTPKKSNFNVGLYAGLSVRQYKPVLALDLMYKGTNLRIMPSYKFNSIGLTQELAKLSTTFYNLYWTASVYAGTGNDSVVYDATPANSYKRTILTLTGATGLKTYFSKRMYTHFMVGAMYNQFTPSGKDDDANWLPYFEFGLGINFIKNYPQLKIEETNE